MKLRNTHSLLLCSAFSLLAASARAEWKRIDTVNPNHVAKSHPGLLAYCRAMADRQYMVANPANPPTVQAPPGWEAVWTDPRMIETRYTVSDSDGTTKKGRVVLFNPSPELLAAWIANAVLETAQSKPDAEGYDEGLALQFAAYIKSQSSAQFPVVGLVWEDLNPKDGVNESYPFLDGITMKASPPVFYADGEKKSTRATRQLDGAGIQQALSLRWGSGYPATFARISSTTREMAKALYQSMGIAVPAKIDGDFAAYVREQHIDAMKKGRNELLVAKMLDFRKTGRWE